MPKSLAVPTLLAAALAGAASLALAQAPAPADRPGGAAHASYARARAVLDRALEASGGAALSSVKDVSRKGTATAYNQGQSLRPADPFSTRTVELMSAPTSRRGAP